MAEGRTTKYYISDTISVFDDTGAGVNAQFRVKVPNNIWAQAELGWQSADATRPTGIGLPTGFKPRHAIGVGTNGKRYRAICATVDCDVFTKVDATWTTIDNAGATITVTRTGIVGEASTG